MYQTLSVICVCLYMSECVCAHTNSGTHCVHKKQWFWFKKAAQIDIVGATEGGHQGSLQTSSAFDEYVFQGVSARKYKGQKAYLTAFTAYFIVLTVYRTVKACFILGILFLNLPAA